MRGLLRVTNRNVVWTGLLMVFCAFAMRVGAQENAPENSVRALGSQVLQLLGRMPGSTPAAQAALRTEAAAHIGQRALQLQALVEQDAELALRLAFPPDVLTRLGAAFPAVAGQIEQQGVWEGPVEYIVEDGLNFTTHRNIVRLSAGGETLGLHFAGSEPPGLKNADVVRVRGMRVGNILAASDATVVAAADPPLMCSAQGAQKSIVLLVTMPGVTAPANIIVPDLLDTFFSVTQRSLSGYWRENSQGATWAEGDVRGWYTLDRVYGCEEHTAIRAAAIAAADADVDFTQYTRVFIIVNGMTGTCTWGGLGTIGCGSLTSSDGSFNASTSWMRPGFFNPDDPLRDGVQIAAHEAGHNLGLRHANSRDYATQVVGPLGESGVVTEYGDLFSSMGRLRNNNFPEPWIGFGHYAVPHKVQLGWLTATQAPTITSSGSFTLQPAEVAGGTTQALKIVRGTEKYRGTTTTHSYWVEYRQPIGDYDSTLYPQVFTGGLIHYEDRGNGGASHLLDFTPNMGVPESANPEVADWSNPALTGNWTDPHTGISITTSNATSTSLNVDVIFGPLQCVRNNPTVTLGPSNPSAVAGGDVEYTVSVTNNDTSVCSNRMFNLSSSLPSGWSTSFSASSVALAPGATNAVTMTKSVPGGSVEGIYDVNATAVSTDGTSSGIALASCTVAPAPAPMVTTLNPLGTYAKNATVPIVATASRTDSTVVAGASVLFTITRPGGATTTKTVLTDPAGRATWNFKVLPKDPAGLYTVNAQATFNGEVANAVPVTFAVSP